MSETGLTADHLIVMGRGRLIADTSVTEFTRRAAHDAVSVCTAEPQRLRPLLVVFGTALYLTVLAVLGVAIGMLTRNTAAGITAVLAVLFILPVLTQLLPAAVAEGVFPYLPSSAGRTLTVLHPDSSMLGPWSGFLLFCLYTVGVLTAVAVVLKRRDG